MTANESQYLDVGTDTIIRDKDIPSLQHQQVQTKAFAWTVGLKSL